MDRQADRVSGRGGHGPRCAGLGLALLSIAALGCAIRSAPEPPVVPEDSRAAVAVVERLQAVVLDLMKNAERLGYDGRVRTLTPVVRQSFDLPSMARRTLGPSWRSLGQDQKSVWLDTFERFHVSAIADIRDAYAGQAFVVLGAQRDARGHVRVHTQLDYPGRQVDIFTDYLLKETTQGWLIFDVFKPPTVSEVTMRRAEYATVFEKRGFEHVLSAMETRILRNQQP